MIHRLFPVAAFGILLQNSALLADPPEPRFRAVTIDDKIQIGYGVAVADVDGDKLPDILLADKKQIVWYRNPGSIEAGANLPNAGWQKFLIAENLTAKDNVCLAAEDIDGDGKCELAVGAEWNPADTEKSGAVFYLIAPADRTQPWTPVRLHAEPTTHRMHWLEFERKKWGLVVVPLHGRGNENGEGAGVRILLYHPPAILNDPAGTWTTELADDSLHLTHNFFTLKTGFMVASKEGAPFIFRDKGTWRRARGVPFADPVLPQAGPGELAFNEVSLNRGFTATIEPMHGHELAVYLHDSDVNARRVLLTNRLVEGHALRSGPEEGQIVVGWRGKPGARNSTTGVAVWTALDPTGEKWRETIVDADGMACEDLQLADLNGDRKLDIVASGRATRNVKIYFNETPAP